MLVERLCWCLPFERLPRSTVERSGDGIEVLAGVPRQVGALREVLTQQTVCVLVGASLPGTVRIAEVDGEVRCDPELRVLSHLGTLIPRQRPPELLGQCRDL